MNTPCAPLMLVVIKRTTLRKSASTACYRACHQSQHWPLLDSGEIVKSRGRHIARSHELNHAARTWARDTLVVFVDSWSHYYYYHHHHYQHYYYCCCCCCCCCNSCYSRQEREINKASKNTTTRNIIKRQILLASACVAYQALVHCKQK